MHQPAPRADLVKGIVPSSGDRQKVFQVAVQPTPTPNGSAGARVLVVGDGPDARDQLSRVLRNCCVDSAGDGEEGLTKLAAAVADGRPYAVAFVDARAADASDGLLSVRAMWAIDPALNVVLCTSEDSGTGDGRFDEVEALADGDDRVVVLRKPFEPVEARRLAGTLAAKWSLARRAAMKDAEVEDLVRRRTAHFESQRDTDRLRMDELEGVARQRTADLRRASTHDELTGLPNRVLLHDRLGQALEAARRDPARRVAALVIDFDRFKLINDSLGHHAGDQLLRAIAQRLAATLRTTDTVSLAGTDDGADCATAARLGGDEFCVLLTGLKRDEDAATVAQRLLAVLEQPYDLAGREIHSTASIGIAVSSSGYERAEDMIRDADNAMYRAKAAGKGRYVIFDRTMHEQVVRRLAVENELRRAVERDELRVHYQPVVRLDEGTVVGVEALVRWQHPQRGIVAPSEFIAVAEETGLIGRLGEWVLGHSCRQLKIWSQVGACPPEMTVSVNVSGRQLADEGFARRVGAVLADTDLDPRRLILEITETALVEQPDTARAVLEAVRATGVRVYLDDFGTGYSSLSCLHAFPLDGLKIDRSFVRDAAGRRRLAAIVQAITSLARDLGTAVVAEGVETMEQVALLQSIDCNNAQGFLFSRPLPADALAGEFARRKHWGVAA